MCERGGIGESEGLTSHSATEHSEAGGEEGALRKGSSEWAHLDKQHFPKGPTRVGRAHIFILSSENKETCRTEGEFLSSLRQNDECIGFLAQRRQFQRKKMNVFDYIKI